jgi:hypothetical protein
VDLHLEQAIEQAKRIVASKPTQLKKEGDDRW